MVLCSNLKALKQTVYIVSLLGIVVTILSSEYMYAN